MEEWLRFIEARFLEPLKDTAGALSPPWGAVMMKLGTVWAGAGKDGLGPPEKQPPLETQTTAK